MSSFLNPANLESTFYRNEVFRLKIVFRKLKMLFDVMSLICDVL